MRLSALLLIFGCGCSGLPASFASTTFDATDDGWTLTGNGEARLELRAVGGSPGGHICAEDNVSGDTWYFNAPNQYLGDASKAFGKRLTWALKQENLYQQIKGRDAILQGNGLSVVFNIKSTPGKAWSPYSARIDGSSGWKIDEEPDFPDATDEQMQTLLRNVTALRLRGEFADGPDAACLDNVFFGVQ
jgi:hypothetical protein